MNPREICERYEKLYTGAVADILDEKGFRRQCLGPALVPSFRSDAPRVSPSRPSGRPARTWAMTVAPRS